MSDTRLITVVMPAMNEQENIAPFFDALAKVTDSLSSFDWEFIFVDDGSTDATVERILAVRQRDQRVKILQLSRNFGSHAAIRAGMDHAAGDAVVCISVDLQDPPELIRSFTELWQQDYDIVWGVRGQRDDPWSKKFSAGLFYRVMRKLGLPGLPDQGMDCGLFDRKVVNAFRRIPDTHNITFMTIYWMGFRQARVPYHRLQRSWGMSKWPLRKILKSAVDVMTSFSYLPVRICSYAGLILGAITLAGLGLLLLKRLVFGAAFGGLSLLTVAILLMGSLQFIFLGILGEYIWRMNTQIRGFPHYIVMNEIGFGDSSEPHSEDAAEGPESAKTKQKKSASCQAWIVPEQDSKC